MESAVAVSDDPYADEERIPPPRKYPPAVANTGVTAAQLGIGEGKWEKGVDMDMDVDVSRGGSLWGLANEIADLYPLPLMFLLCVYCSLSCTKVLRLWRSIIPIIPYSPSWRSALPKTHSSRLPKPSRVPDSGSRTTFALRR